MGEAARRSYLRRTTPTQRFDHGLELSDEMISAFLARHGFRAPFTPESARTAFVLLRKLGG